MSDGEPRSKALLRRSLCLLALLGGLLLPNLPANSGAVLVEDPEEEPGAALLPEHRVDQEIEKLVGELNGFTSSLRQRLANPRLLDTSQLVAKIAELEAKIETRVPAYPGGGADVANKRALFWARLDALDALKRNDLSFGRIAEAKATYQRATSLILSIGSGNLEPKDIKDFEIAASRLISAFASLNPNWTPFEKLGEVLKLARLANDEHGQRFIQGQSSSLYSRAMVFSGFDPLASKESSAATCYDASKWRTRALLVGNQNYPNQLRGPANDVKIMDRSLRRRGVSEITTLIDADRRALVMAMRKLVSETRCGDTAIFHFSGHRAPKVGVLLGLGNGVMPVYGLDEQIPPSVITNAEISDLITAIRNRRSTAIVVLDAGTHVSEIQALQAEAAAHRWIARASKAEKWSLGSAAEVTRVAPLRIDPGQFAIFDGSDGTSDPIEQQIAEKEGEPALTYGALTFAIARSIQTQDRPMIRSIAEGVAKELGRLQYGAISVAASDEELTIVTADNRMPTSLDFQISDSPATRNPSSITIKSRTFTFSGRIANRERYRLVTVNDLPVELRDDGAFMVEVSLASGQTSFKIEALDRSDRFQTRAVNIIDESGDAPLPATGKHYALVIAVQNYDDERLPDLATPLEDGRSIADLLKTEYGFETALESEDGNPATLLLLDPTLDQIQETLEALRKRLSEEDSVLIYFAGHGKYFDDNNVAYWIPRDGDPDNDSALLGADALINKIKRMRARSILILSDSCFSGAMSREPPDWSAYDADRKQALLKQSALKSRIFISSGGNEPVLDGGCKESSKHSIFACAFLSALKEIKEPIFSSGELHQMHLLPKVSGRSEQQPERREIRDSGHENGDFIFVHAKP